ncbi:MAG TPA: response regulator, partial [Pilimelia sp.]|nr:response regulator [Pilimelia sp.]
VVRPLPDLAVADRAVGGVTVDTDGVPRAVLDPLALVTGPEPAAPRRAAAPAPAPQAVAPRRVLVVDDSLTTRMLERSILESAGYRVDLAASGEEGLRKAADGGYALILVDVEMPGIDGFTFLERLRADQRLADIPAIMLSSRAAAEDRRRGVAAGAQAYLVKSEFDQGELLARIRDLVGA